MKQILHGLLIPESVWELTRTALSELDSEWLQVEPVWRWLQGFRQLEQGAEWRSQRRRALALASTGYQRAPGDSKRGLDHLLPPGLGKEEHVAQACDVPHPFSTPSPMDTDLKFVMHTAQVFGEDLPLWRSHQTKVWDSLVQALEPLYTVCHQKRAPDARSVAATKNPAVMAYLTTILRWPDREQARQYVVGFDLVIPP